MAKNAAGNFAVELLRKHKVALEINIKGVAGMMVDAERVPHYRRQVRELKKAITYLELFEVRKQRKVGRG